MLLQQQALRERTRSLVHSGSVWSDKIVEDQRGLVRQLSLHAIGVDQSTDLLGIGLHIAEGGAQPRGAYSWAFTRQDIKSASAGRWGYLTGTATDGAGNPTYTFKIISTSIEVPEVMGNTTGETLPFIQEGGMITLLPQGTNATQVPVAGYIEIPDLPHYLGTSGIGIATPSDSCMGVTTEDDEPFLILGSRFYLSLQMADTMEVARSHEAAWFMRLPSGTLPMAIETAVGEFVEGSAFHVVDGWLILRQDPYLLWPDGFAHATTVLSAPDGPKHFVLKTDRSQASGKWVANYKRQSQSPGSFIKALAEVAGLPIFEEDDQVILVEACASGFHYHTSNGNAFLLPGPAAYTVGDFLITGEFPRALLDIRCQSLQGSQWWDGRFWTTEGIPISALRPGFDGFFVGPALTLAEAYEDPYDGALRARLMFNQALDEELRFWEWQAAMERRAGVETFAKGVLGFSHPRDSKWVNPLQIYAGILGPWLWVIESPLPRYSRGIWREVEDFIAREKPAGVIVAGVAT